MRSNTNNTTDANEPFLRSYVRGEAAFGIWGLVAQGLAGVNALIIISQLDVYRYGLYVLVFAFYYLVGDSLLRPLSNLVVSDIVRFNAEGKQAEAKKLFIENTILRFFLAGIITIGVYFGAEIIAHYYEEDMALLFRIIAVTFLIDVWATSMRTIFQVHLYFNAMALRQILYRFLKFVFIVIFLGIFPFGIREALIAHVLATFFAAVSCVPLFLRLYRPWRRVKAASHSVLFRIVKTYGKWSIFGTAFTSFTQNIRPWIIQFFVNTEAVALFAVAEGLYGAIKTFIPTSTLRTLIPREVREKKRMGRILLRGTKYLVLWGAILGVVSFFAVPPLIKFFIPHYGSAVPVFMLLLIVLALHGFRSLGMLFLIALRHQRFIFFISVFNIVFGLIASVSLVYLFGIWGMALERIMITLIVGTVSYWYLFRHELRDAEWKTLYTFDAEDTKFLRTIWSTFVTQAKQIIARTHLIR